MAIIKINAACIAAVRCGNILSDNRIEVVLQMTENQMKDALGKFLENCTDADFEEWIEEILPEFRKTESES